ncbi:JmjC domain-containing protein [Bradyrhizobium sp. USDA 10063]
MVARLRRSAENSACRGRWSARLKGKKTWKIYRDRVELPIAKMAYVDVLNRESPYDMYELLPGDLLYLPRGVFHEAATEASVSLHLTVSLSTLCRFRGHRAHRTELMARRVPK